MANFKAIYAVGESLVTLLNDSFPSDLIGGRTPAFALHGTGQLKAAEPAAEPTIGLLLYRISHNEHLRALGRPGGESKDPVPLSVDLHYLLTVWAGDAQDEQVLMAWALYQLFRSPFLDRTVLRSPAAWHRGDQVQLVPAELSTEDLSRIWEASAPSQRLSMPFLARGVRIEPQPIPPSLPVVAQRFAYSSVSSEEEASP